MGNQDERNTLLKNRQIAILIISISSIIGFFVTTYLLLTNWAAAQFVITLSDGTYVTNWATITILVFLSLLDAGFFSAFALMIYSYFKTDSQRQQIQRMDRGDWKFTVAVIGTFVLLLASILMINFISLITMPSGFQLALVIVFGVMTLLSSLVIASVVLKVLGLQDPKEALGLPPGSVRAIIALMLILIFAIMSIFMYEFLNQESKTTIVTVVQNVTNNGTGNYTFTNSTTTTIGGASEAMIDFSKQTLTTLSTLVVALAAFYFGTRSVAQAQKSTQPPEARIEFDPTSPYTLEVTDEAKPEDNALSITVKTTPENEVVSFKQPDKGKIERTDDPNVFLYKVDPKDVLKTQPVTVKLRFWMINYRGDAKEFEVKLSKK